MAACWWLVDLELEAGVGHEAVDMRPSVGRPGVLYLCKTDYLIFDRGF